MSVLGIASTALSQLGNIQSKFQGVQSEFKTLGQDLQAGNLTQAQTDFVTLSQSVTSQLSGSNSSFATAFNAVGQALQSGDLTGAQQAFAAISPGGTGAAGVRHHHHTPPTQTSTSSAQSNLFAQELSTLGQALQSGNLTAAQQAFSAMQQGWQQTQGSGTSGSLLPPVSSGVNVTV
jgi:predicted lipoprotein